MRLGFYGLFRGLFLMPISCFLLGGGGTILGVGYFALVVGLGFGFGR